MVNDRGDGTREKATRGVQRKGGEDDGWESSRWKENGRSERRGSRVGRRQTAGVEMLNYSVTGRDGE